MKWKLFKKQNENPNENFEMKNEDIRKEYERRRKEEVLNNREDDRWYDKKNE